MGFSGAFQGPHLLLLKNGVLVLCYGRPGMSVSFSFDGEGRRWSHHVRLVQGYRDRQASEPAFGDTSSGFGRLESIADDSFLVAYDAANYFARAGDVPRNAVLARPISVTRLERGADGTN